MQHPLTRPVSFAGALAALVALGVCLAALLGAPRSVAHVGAPAPGEAASVNETAVAASVAAPDAFPIGGPEWQRALEIAQAHWGAAPCGGEVAFQWTGLEPLTNARATWHNPSDAWAAPDENFDCRVDFNASMRFDFPQLCTVLTHELGHLLGHPHAAASGQLMSAIYTDPIPACASADPAAAAAAAPAPAQPPAARTTAAASRKVKTVATRTPARKVRRAKRCFMRMKAGRRVRMCVGGKKAGRKRLSRRALKR